MGSDPIFWCQIVSAHARGCLVALIVGDCNNAGAGYPAPASCRQAGRCDRRMVSASAAASAGVAAATTAAAATGVTTATATAAATGVTAATIGCARGLFFDSIGNATAAAATCITTTTRCWHF
jgi:hypothetical protein